MMKTKLGTEPYIAPEIHEGKPYDGTKVDIFSLGVTIFISVAGNPPFAKADDKCMLYEAIKRKEWEIYWKAITRNQPDGKFSNDFRDLIQKMLAYEPDQRPSLSDIKQHSWFNGPVAHIDEIREYF